MIGCASDYDGGDAPGDRQDSGQIAKVLIVEMQILADLGEKGLLNSNDRGPINQVPVPTKQRLLLHT
jgi:hypothetical protein